jgi:hypothetical protein
MSAIKISVDSKALMKSLDKLKKEQFPFAMATALNATAERLKKAEQTNMKKIIDRPTPFTVNSVGMRKAHKGRLEARVYIKPIAETYLLPYEFGGTNKLNSKALLKPVDQAVNKYGNLPRNQIAKLLADPDVFAGSVTFRRSGETINGIWRRPNYGKRRGKNGVAVRRGSKGKTNYVVNGIRTGLQLLVKFEDAHPVTQHLGFLALGRKTVPRDLYDDFQKAMKHAIATAF